jgi:hypothetical protein
MTAPASQGDQSGNYLGLYIALAVIAGILVVFAGLWIHFHGY